MIDPHQADNRLRATLSSLHRSPRYRSEAVPQHRPVPPSRHTELNRELKGGPRFTGWRLFLVSLIVFTVIDYFYLRRWG